MNEAIVNSAKNLPGWNWIDYDDCSGYLKSPQGKYYFCYDLSPYAVVGGIEFRFDDTSEYDIAYCNLKTFKKYAENIIILKGLNKNDS